MINANLFFVLPQWFTAIALHLLKEYRLTYPSWVSWGSAIFATLLSLVAYWYTAKAFGSGPQSREPDYFQFLVVNEVILALPISLVGGPAAALREYLSEGVLESFRVLPISRLRILLGPVASYALQQSLQALAIFGAASLLLGLALPLRVGARALLVTLLALPAFLGLGLLSAGVFMRFGRGDSFITTLNTVGAVLGGAYFPSDLFPEFLQNTGGRISPYSILLTEIRNLSKAVDPFPAWTATGALLGQGLFLLPLGYFTVIWGFHSLWQRGALVRIR